MNLPHTLGLIALVFMVPGGCCAELVNPRSPFIMREILYSKTNNLKNIRVTITHNINTGTNEYRDITTVEIGNDRSMRAISFRSDHPESNWIRYLKNNQIVQYQNAVLKSGNIQPARSNSVLTASISNLDKLDKSFDSECLQLNALTQFDGDEVYTDHRDRFKTVLKGSAIEEEVEGVFSPERKVLINVQYQTSNQVQGYIYNSFTNFAGSSFPTELTRFAQLPGKPRVESKVSIQYAPLLSPPDISGITPPLGTEVTDEKFDPPLVYTKTKLTYSDEELKRMWENAKRVAGNGSPTAAPKPAVFLLSPVHYGILALTFFVLVGALFYWRARTD